MTQGNVAAAGHGHGEHGGHIIIPKPVLVRTLIGLLFLTFLTVVVARPVSGFDAGIFNTLIAFLIATVKAGLVLTFFMGLKYDKKTNLVIFLTGIFFLLVLLLFCVLDIYTRVLVHSTL